MQSHIDVVNYFKEAVAQSIHIEDSNFFRMDITEIQGQMRKGINSPCLALESHEGNFENSKPNNSIDVKTFAFLILGKPQHNNFDDQNQVLDQTELIGKKFLARMRYNSTQPAHKLYGVFDLSLCNYHKVGPIYLGWYGYRFEVTLKPKKIDLKVNPEDWQDIDSAC
jgi:hypothetical protein